MTKGFDSFPQGSETNRGRVRNPRKGTNLPIIACRRYAAKGFYLIPVKFGLRGNHP